MSSAYRKIQISEKKIPKQNWKISENKNRLEFYRIVKKYVSQKSFRFTASREKVMVFKIWNFLDLEKLKKKIIGQNIYGLKRV